MVLEYAEKMRFWQFTAGIATLLVGAVLAQSTRQPLPTVQPPGAVQPIAPGYRPTAGLPQIKLEPAIPEVKKVEYASNGFIEVAHALVLEPRREAGEQNDFRLAHAAVSASYAARPGLAEVDVSVYEAESFDGIGGPLPRLTAGVPRAELLNFLNAKPNANNGYDRQWLNPNITAPKRAPQPVLEQTPVFHGTTPQLRSMQVQQLAAQVSGGAKGGLYFFGNSRKPYVALTFDDAPHPLFEPLLLDSLRRAGIKATFFCIGRNALAYPYFVKDMVRDGHEIGNHTFHHVRLPKLPAIEVQDELEQTNALLQKISGQTIRYFRPPGGEYSAQTLKIATSLGLITTFWTDDPGDFDNPGDKVLESRLKAKLRRGGIVLLHDNVLETIQIVVPFLKVASQERFDLVPIGQLDAQDGRP